MPRRIDSVMQLPQKYGACGGAECHSNAVAKTYNNYEHTWYRRRRISRCVFFRTFFRRHTRSYSTAVYYADVRIASLVLHHRSSGAKRVLTQSQPGPTSSD